MRTMSKKGKTPEKKEEELKRLIKELTKYDDMEYSRAREEELNEIRDELVSIGKPAVPQLIEILNRHEAQSCRYAAATLGAIGDEKT